MGGKYEEHMAMMDIFSALFKGHINIKFGHYKEYWNEDPRNQALEVFANISSMDILGTLPNEEILKSIIAAYKEIVNERVD